MIVSGMGIYQIAARTRVCPALSANRHPRVSACELRATGLNRSHVAHAILRNHAINSGRAAFQIDARMGALPAPHASQRPQRLQETKEIWHRRAAVKCTMMRSAQLCSIVPAAPNAIPISWTRAATDYSRIRDKSRIRVLHQVSAPRHSSDTRLEQNKTDNKSRSQQCKELHGEPLSPWRTIPHRPIANWYE